ncbi:MAG: hypothetical protein ABIH21_04280 [Patescibacteria group bacterium]
MLTREEVYTTACQFFPKEKLDDLSYTAFEQLTADEIQGKKDSENSTNLSEYWIVSYGINLKPGALLIIGPDKGALITNGSDFLRNGLKYFIDRYESGTRTKPENINNL